MRSSHFDSLVWRKRLTQTGFSSPVSIVANSTRCPPLVSHLSGQVSEASPRDLEGGCSELQVESHSVRQARLIRSLLVLHPCKPDRDSCSNHSRRLKSRHLLTEPDATGASVPRIFELTTPLSRNIVLRSQML